MKQYVPLLLDNISKSFGLKDDDLEINVDVMLTEIDVDVALPLGLILNEWLTNVFKHAYVGITYPHRLEISLVDRAGAIAIKIKDNGVGIPPGTWDNPGQSFGIKLMKVLIKQIRGKCHIENDKGTTFTLDVMSVRTIL